MLCSEAPAARDEHTGYERQSMNLTFLDTDGTRYVVRSDPAVRAEIVPLLEEMAAATRESRVIIRDRM